MLRTPLKNSKNVSKPFKSPFESPAQNKEQGKSNNKKNIKHVNQSPVSSRSVEAKRVLDLEDSDENETKRRKVSHIDKEKINVVPDTNVTKTDLHALKRKIFELRQDLDCLKSRERCSKKHNPKELRASINKWKSACQSAIETVCSIVSERNSQSTSIPDVLKMLGIPETVVDYSEKEDSFL